MKFQNYTDAVRYIEGGKATVTFRNPQTNNRYTYNINQSKHSTHIMFVSVLVAPNEYMYIGYIKNHVFHYSKKSKLPVDARSIKTFRYVYHKLQTNSLKLVEIYHHGNCGRCGRILTVPKSIEIGFGSFCLTKVSN